ncbi:nucleotidyltransferase family protein [Longispora albida]|uniref:nucleotidyltransferase family protein n=1 Tax=Longispora albida TaxID=203523 RepID=UPI00036A98F5|nr:nucleotidyltransferase family protein [Longispora albida]
MAEAESELLISTLKRTAAVLQEASIPFVLAGKFAVHARGGPLSEHDVDFLIQEKDADRALDALSDAGFRAERPPENWLVKVYEDDRLVDLIFRPVDRPVTEGTLADSDQLPVYGVRIPVLSATELMIHTLWTFSENVCDFGRALPTARSLREQIDWDRVAKETAGSPYATAFLVLLGLLEVTP